MAFTGNITASFFEAEPANLTNPIVAADVYQLVVLILVADTTGPETGCQITLDGFPSNFVIVNYVSNQTLTNPSNPASPYQQAGNVYLNTTFDLGATIPAPPPSTSGVLLAGWYGYFTTSGDHTFTVDFTTTQSGTVTATVEINVTGSILKLAGVRDVATNTDVDDAVRGYWTDANSDAGPAEIEVVVGPTPSYLGRIFQMRVNGQADRTIRIENVSKVELNTSPAAESRYTLTGRDWVSEFDDALVDPPQGLAARPQVQTVRFDWTHPDLPTPTVGGPGVQWIRPYNMGSMYKGSKNALGENVTPDRLGKVGQAPRGWPDAFSGWMWERPYSLPPASSHPVMTAWFHLSLTFIDPWTAGNRGSSCHANRPFIMVFTGDDFAQLAFDGAVVDSGTEPPAIQWQRCNSIVIPDVSPGTHVVRIKATNLPYLQYGGQYNIGSVAFCAFQPLADITGAAAVPPTNVGLRAQLQETYDPVHNLVVRTARNASTDPGVGSQLTASGNNLMAGGGWYCIAGEHVGGDPEAGFTGGFVPPGFTVGRAFRLLFESAQASGHLAGWTLGFTDTNDSNGNAWPITEELTARVSDTLLAVMRRWHDEGQWDFASHPSQRTLYAYRWQERGNFRLNGGPSGTPVRWTEYNVSNLTITEEW